MLIRGAVRAVSLAGLLCLAGPVAARGLNYSYVDVGYQRTNGDPVDVDAGAVDLSVGLMQWLALRGGYERGTVDNYPGDSPDLSEFRAGARAHFSVTDSLDLFGDVQYFNQKLNGKSTHTDLGFVDEAGVRFQAAKPLELNASYKYIGGDLNDHFGTVGLVYDLTKVVALSARGEFNNDIQRYFAGLRLSF